MTQKNIPLSFSDFLRKGKMMCHADFEDIILKETVVLEGKFVHFYTEDADAEKEDAQDPSLSLHLHILYQDVMSGEIYIGMEGVKGLYLNKNMVSLEDFKALMKYLSQVVRLSYAEQENFSFSSGSFVPEAAYIMMSPTQITVKGGWLSELSLSSDELVIEYQSASVDLFLEEGLLPSEVDYLKTFSADRLALFRLFCGDMDDEMLSSIAEADYGYDALCFEFLKQIQDAKEIPGQVPEDRQFQVGEVLGLTGYGSTVQTRRDKITQAFACLVLAIGNYHYVMCSEDNEEFRLIVIFLVTSGLEKPYQEAALKFFLWYITTNRAYQNNNGLVYLLIIGLMVQLGFEGAKIEPLVLGLKQSDFVRYMNFDSETEIRVEYFHKTAHRIRGLLDGLENKKLKLDLQKVVEDILKQSYTA